MNKKLFRSSFSNVSILGVKFCVTFVMTPIYVRALGNHDYGIWEIGVSILGYMGLLQFGIPPAIVRYVANYTALGDKDNLDRLYSTAISLLGCIGLVCALALATFAVLAPGVLTEGAAEDSLRYTYYLLIMASQVVVVFLGMLFQSFHEGCQRYHLTNAITAFNSVTGAVVLYLLLTNGFGLIALAAGNTIGMGLKFLTFQQLLRTERYGGFRFRLRNVSRESLRHLLSFGAKSFVLGISGRVAGSTAPIIIGAFINPATVPFYTIPAGLVRRVSNTVHAITLGFMPYFSELFARNESERTLRTFFDASRFIVGFVLGSYLGILFLGLPFISRWIGPSYAEKGEIVFYAIALYFLWPLLNPLHGRVLTSMARHDQLAKVRVWDALLNLALSLTMVQFWGIEGVALSAVFSKSIFEPIVLLVVCRNLEFPVWRYLREVLLPLVPPMLLGAAAYYLLLQAVTPDRYRTILLIAALGSAVYGAAFGLLSVSAQERHALAATLRKTIGFRMPPRLL